MNLILFEGQPGSGKTSQSSFLYKYLVSNNYKSKLIDEVEQDDHIFTDYWENFNVDKNSIIDEFLFSWERFLSNSTSNNIIIMDNAILNQVTYLMALNISNNEINNFYEKFIKIIHAIKVLIVFCDGNSETIIRRVNDSRKNNWGDRVSELLDKTPYQRSLNRLGLEGMIEFFNDSQILKRKLLAKWPYYKLNINVTDGNWNEYRKRLTKYIKEKIDSGDFI